MLAVKYQEGQIKPWGGAAVLLKSDLVTPDRVAGNALSYLNQKLDIINSYFS